MRSRPVPADAQLALLLEVAATPTPGNVDRHRDLADLRFEHLLAGGMGASPGLQSAASGEPIGESFETAVAGMSAQSAGNTQFGGLLLLVPLVRAASDGALAPEGVTSIVEETTVEDAVAFYEAFEHVDVRVGERPPDVDAPDVGRGAEAADDLRTDGWTLYDVMVDSTGVDDVAREWTSSFERSFAVADRIEAVEGPILDRAATAFLDQLATHPDTHVAKRHGRQTAERVRDWAARIRDNDGDVEGFASSLVDEGVNPGTTADVLAAGLFVALRRGVTV